MNNTEQHLKRIQEKLQLLLKHHHALQKENNLLKEELESAVRKYRDQQKSLDELKQQVGILKLNAGEMSEPDKKDFEKRINVYLKEIDRCIALLSE